MSRPMTWVLVWALLASAGCLSSNPYRRLAKELSAPLAGTKRRVAVVPFRGIDPSLNLEAEAVSERLLSQLYGKRGIELVERSHIQQVLSETSLGQTGALDAKSVAELGRLAGAQALVLGTVTRGRKGLEVSARVVDVTSGLLLAAASANLPQESNKPVAADAPPPVRPAPVRAAPPARPAERGEVDWRPGADLGAGTKAPWPVAVCGVAALKGRLYVVGGASGRVAGRGDAAVYSAAIAADGALGRWRAELPLPDGRYQITAVAFEGWLFAVGGYQGSPRDEVFASRVGKDGVLGGWKVAGRIPTGCTMPGVAVAEGSLHVAACTAPSGQVHALFSAPLSEEGTLGEWTRTPLPAESGAGNAVVLDGKRLLLVGGTPDLGGFSPAVYAVPLDRLGKPGAATLIGSLSTGKSGVSAAVVDGRLWVLGGKVRYKNADVIQDVLESAALTPKGGLGPWQRSSRRTSPAVWAPFAPFVDGAFYHVGGESAQDRVDAVQRVPIR